MKSVQSFDISFLLWGFDLIWIRYSPNGVSRSHSLNTPHSVGLLLMRDQPYPDTSDYTQHSQEEKTHNPRGEGGGFEPTIPAIQLPQTHAVDHVVTGLPKVTATPIEAYCRPISFQEFEAPRFLDNGHMKVLRLSALRIGRLYPPGNILGTQFC